MLIFSGSKYYVGSYQDAKARINEQTEIIDLNLSYVLPGFIDNHNHVFEAASPAAGDCLVAPDASLQEQREFLSVCQKT